ncbi:hypothetical protein [Haloglomus halophilum]|uniref:hypothetical protein n=1 Tax=Haloglomus halophilum TaxID=2962672 RepID=UPI0020C9B9B8|nr:hypothetical protein [Haloglomus halophilum]
MVDVPDTAYINHAWSKDKWKPIIAALYRSKIAAIHFGDFPVSLTESEWADAGHKNSNKSSIGRLSEYAREGRILAVSYSGHPALSGGRYVGTVGSPESASSDSDRMLLLVCEYGEEVEPQNAIVDYISVPIGANQDQIESQVDDLNNEAAQYVHSVIENRGSVDSDGPSYKILKGIQLNKNDVEWVWNQDFPGLWAANKRGTIMGWNTGDQHLYAAYYSAVSDHVDIDRLDDVYDIIGRDKSSVWALSEGQLEALCGEYLRRQNDSYVELISAGGSLSEADIFAGIENDDREIVAQVTFEKKVDDAESKLRKLLSYSQDDPAVELIFFGPKEVESKLPDTVEDTKVSDIYTPIEEVLQKFESGMGTEFVEMLLSIKLSGGNPKI